MNTVDRKDHAVGRVRLTVDNWFALIGLILSIAGGLYVALDRRFSKIEDAQRDHEIRLTRREANAFTAKEANELANNVGRLSIIISEQEKDISEYRSNVNKFNDLLKTTPSDVYKLLEEVKKSVDENSRDLKSLKSG